MGSLPLVTAETKEEAAVGTASGTDELNAEGGPPSAADTMDGITTGLETTLPMELAWLGTAELCAKATENVGVGSATTEDGGWLNDIAETGLL